MGFPGGSVSKESACSAGDPGSIPGSGRSPGGGNGNPLQYSFLENPMDRGAWWATVHKIAKSQTILSANTHKHRCASPKNKDLLLSNCNTMIASKMIKMDTIISKI